MYFIFFFSYFRLNAFTSKISNFLLPLGVERAGCQEPWILIKTFLGIVINAVLFGI